VTKKSESMFTPCLAMSKNGRGDRIRTCDLFTPSEARHYFIEVLKPF
jgi:hypothetical protein